MAEPCDGVALAASSAVLDQIVLPGTVTLRMSNKSPDRIELVVSREYQGSLAGLFPFVVFQFYNLQVLSDDLKKTVLLPDLVPQIGRLEAIRVIRIACSAITPSVEG